MNRAVFLVASLALMWQLPRSPQTAATFLVLPFRDESGFSGEQWDLQDDLPRVLCDTLARTPGLAVVPFVKVKTALETQIEDWQPASLTDELQEWGLSHDARYALLGTVQEFSITRFDVGNPMLGGYTSHRVRIQVRYTLVDLVSGETVATRTASADVRNRQMSLTLLGKPSEEDIDYAALDTMAFDSEAFRRTLVGRAVHQWKSELIGQLRSVLPAAAGAPATNVAFQEAAVVLVREGEVYIAAGSADGVQPGDEFEVFTQGEELRDPNTHELLGHADKRVGRIRVEAVRDQHLSLASILEGHGDIRSKDRVRLRALPNNP